MPESVYPLIFEPLIQEDPWGGINNFTFKAYNTFDRKISKLILFSDFLNIKIQNGFLSGSAFSRAKKLWKEALLGLNFEEFLDAPLNLQVELIITEKISPIWEFNNSFFSYILNANNNSYFFSNVKDYNNLTDNSEIVETKFKNFLHNSLIKNNEIFISKKKTLLAISPNTSVLNINFEKENKIYNWNYNKKSFLPNDDKTSITAINLKHLEENYWEKPNFNTEQVQLNNFKIEKINTNSFSDKSNNKAIFIIPINGQARLRSNSASPNLRIYPGLSLLIPSALGRYTLESSHNFSFLKITF